MYFSRGPQNTSILTMPRKDSQTKNRPRGKDKARDHRAKNVYTSKHIRAKEALISQLGEKNTKN